MSIHQRRPGGGHQRGQALTEFLAVSLALVPLFLLIPILAKYQDIGHATQMASRYIAFEATTRNDTMSTWRPEAELANDVRRRFFTRADAPIRTNEIADDSANQRHRSWRGPTGDPLIANVNTDVMLSFGAARNDRHANAFIAANDGTIFALHDELGLRARGIYRGNVSVRLANLPQGLQLYEPFDRLNLVIERSTSLLIEPWAGRDATQVIARVGGSPAVFPAGRLAALRPMVDAGVRIIDAPGGEQAPLLGQLEFWRDVVPNDRLATGAPR